MNIKTCSCCQQSLELKEFYTTKQIDKYSDGHLNICKKCIGERVNNYLPQTYLWVLKEVDVPYIEDEWDTLCRRYADNTSPVAILGRYLSKMKLMSFKSFTYADSPLFRKEREHV